LYGFQYSEKGENSAHKTEYKKAPIIKGRIIRILTPELILKKYANDEKIKIPKGTKKIAALSIAVDKRGKNNAARNSRIDATEDKSKKALLKPP